jgi:hypothetical protein
MYHVMHQDKLHIPWLVKGGKRGIVFQRTTHMTVGTTQDKQCNVTGSIEAISTATKKTSFEKADHVSSYGRSKTARHVLVHR